MEKVKVQEKPNQIESSNQMDDSERKTIKESDIKDPTLSNETPIQKSPWYKNKLKLGLIIGIGTLVIVIAIIIAVVTLNKNKKINDCVENNCVPGPEEEEEEENIVDINYKKGEVNVYNDVISKISTLVIEKEENIGTGRRLKEEKKESMTTFKGKYLLNVYDVDKTTKPNIYYASAVLLVLNNITNGKTNYLGGSDIRKSDTDFPFIKFSFDSTGKIGKLYVPIDYDKVITAYIYEFIEKIVPKLDKSSYGRRLQGQSQLSYIEKDNKTFLNKEDKKDFEGFDGSENNRNIEAIVEGNKIKEVKTSSKTSFERKNTFNVDKNSNFSEENTNNTISTRTSPVKGFYETSNSSLTLDSSEENDDLTNKIIKNINSKELSEYNNENNSNQSIENRVLNSKLLLKNQLRNLDDIYLDPWGQPINFLYPLFNVDFLGAKIGLYADISFTPTNGKFDIQIYFLKNNNFIKIGSESVRTNFDDVLYAINKVIEKLQVLIETQVIFELEAIYNDYTTTINNQLDRLFSAIAEIPDLSNAFQQPLSELFNLIRNASANCYNNACDNAVDLTSKLQYLYDSITRGEESYLKNIIQITKSNLNNILNNHLNDADDIYEAAKVFYPGIKEAIEKKIEFKNQSNDYTPFNFDITTFYDIQDIYTKVINILSSFKDRIENAISVENITFYNEVNNQFNEILDTPLKNVEIISYNARNNASVIDAMRIFWGNQEGDRRRKLLINNINSLRVKINDMITVIFNKIKDTYDSELLKSETFKTITNNLNNYANEIKANQTSLMTFLRNYVKYDTNFTLYVEDVKILLKVNYEAMKSRESNYQKIYDTITGMVDLYLTESKKTAINNNLNGYLQKIISSTRNYSYGYALNYANQLKSEVKNIILNYLNETVYNEVVAKYTDKTLLNNMITSYYTEVYKAYFKFNSTFYTQHFVPHINKYVSKPQEIITKFNQIVKSQEKEKSSQIENINLLIVNSINAAIEAAYYKVYDMVYNVKEEFRVKAPKNTYGNMGTNRAKYEEIESKLDEILGLFFENGEINIIKKYKKSKIDEFSLSEIINEEEYKIYLLLYTISDELDKNSIKYICEGNTAICINGELKEFLSAIDQYNYQVAKLRDSITQLKNLIPIAETMMDDSLSKLNPEEFIDNYSQYEYLSFQIASDLKIYLEEISARTNQLMEPYITAIKTTIIKIFEENINGLGIEEAIEIMARNIFVDPNSLFDEINKYLVSNCGPKNRIIELFTQEINYYLFKGYTFDPKAYDESFASLKETINGTFEEQKETLFNDITLQYSKVNLNIITELYNIIDSGYNDLNAKIKALSIFENYQFLDHVIYLDSIIEEALNKKKAELESQINTKVNEIYNTHLTSLKVSLREQVKKYFDKIIEVYDNQYNASITYYNEKKGKDGIIDDISVSLEIQTVFNDFIEKVKEIYTETSLNEEIKQAQDKQIKEGINILVVYNEENDELINKINAFITAANKRYIDEQLEFKANIESAFVKGYNKTIIDFLKGKGINSINSIFEEDYKSIITHTFFYLTEEVENIRDYMLVLMESSDLKLLAERLTKSLKTIYNDVKEEFNHKIPIQVTNVVYKKILLFENEVLNKIPEMFISKLKIQLESSDFKVNMQNNQRVLNLIPKSFAQGFNANLTSILKEMLDLNSLDNIRNLYKTKVDEDLLKLSNLMININSIIGDAASNKAQGQTTLDSSTAIAVYENYEKVISRYNLTFVLEINNTKIESIKGFFNNYLLNDIKSIRTGFEEQIQIGERQVQIAMQAYHKIDVYNNVKNNLEGKNIKVVVSDVKNTLKETMDNLPNAIFDKFKKGLDDLENQCKDISVSGFKLKNNRRNLKEYTLNNLFQYINFAYQDYKKFNKTILTNSKFVQIRTKEGSFYNTLANSILHLDDYFDTYEYLIKEYTALGTFTESYRTQSVNIQNYIRKFLEEQSTTIDNTINSINQNVRNSWNSIKKNIDSSIKIALDKQFGKLLSSIQALEEGKNIKIENIKSEKIGEPIDVYDNKNQLLFTINLETKANNMTYGYSMKPVKDDNMYNFDVSLYTSGYISVIISTEIGDFYKGRFEGVLGSGEIGIHPYYYMSDKSVEVEAYFQSASSSYLSIWEEFNLNDLQFQKDINVNVTVTQKPKVKFTKVYRQIVKEP